MGPNPTYRAIHDGDTFVLSVQPDFSWRFVNLSTGKLIFEGFSGKLEEAKKKAAEELGVKSLEWETLSKGKSAGRTWGLLVTD